MHLIPVASFLTLGGKCAECASPIALRYPLVELAGAAAGLAAAALFGVTAAAGGAFVFFLFLIALAAIDLETGYLPDALTLPLIALGLLANGFNLFTTPASAAIGAVAGFAAFAAIGWAFRKARGADGLGLGDAKLLAALGAWLGWPALPFVVFIGAMAALLCVLALRTTGKVIKADAPIPFGPALAAAGALAMGLRGAGIGLL